MATKISAVMTVIDQMGNKASKSITDISPNANPNTVVDFVKALNDLTYNTLDGIELVTKTDILSDYDENDPQFIVSPKEITELSSAFSLGRQVTFTFAYKGAQRNVTASGKKPSGGSLTFDQENKTLTVQGSNDDLYQDGDVEADLILTLPASENYPEATAVIKMYGAADNQFSNV